MATNQMSGAIQHLRRALRHGAGPTDKQLLLDYISRRDTGALAALVQRHAPMVWGVCRRVLANLHDAEDAFQATFLVLVRRAASIAAPELLANWLYGVAHQTALKARSTAAKRKLREGQVTDMPEPESRGQGSEDGIREWNDLQPLLDQELSRLPDIHRVVIVLCDLEGKTRAEAARQLDLPEGTVASRLARARVMLAKRLSQRGIKLSGGALAAALAHNVASAGVPESVVLSTITIANLMTAGQTAAAGLVSARVTALTEGVLKAMCTSKVKTAFALVAVVGLLGLGGGIVIWQTHANAREIPVAEPEAPARNEAMPDLSGSWRGDGWGTVVLQRAKEGGFDGTYTDTFGKDTGRVDVRWVGASRRFEGTWSEGKFRFGRIALEAARDGDTISGTYTTDPKAEHDPGVPSLASLSWRRVKTTQTPSDKLKAIGGAMQAYFDIHKAYPGPAVYSKDGKPLLSWRVALLPFLDQDNLYKQFRLDEPWDSDHNREMLAKMPDVYRGVGIKNAMATPYQGFVGPGALFEGPNGLGYGDIPDGTSNTIAVIEAATPVPWTKPEDLPYSATGRIPELGSASPDIAYALFADGRVHALKRQFDSDALRIAITRADGIPTPFDKLLAAAPIPDRREKEVFTAWGQPIGNLQAGLGFRPGEHRVHHHGETVAVVLRVRNVGKEALDFKNLWAFFAENPPTLTNPNGKAVELPRVQAEGFHVPRITKIAPGQEVDLYEWKFHLQPTGGKDQGLYTIRGTGRFGFQCEHIVGPTSANPNHPNRALDNLATEKLELDVSADPPAGKDAPPAAGPGDANQKPVRIRVYIEKVNLDTATITASCMLIGEFDGVTKPVRMENLHIAEKAKITDGGKELKLSDLKDLPRDTHYYLTLKFYEEEFGFEVVGIETIRK